MVLVLTDVLTPALLVVSLHVPQVVQVDVLLVVPIHVPHIVQENAKMVVSPHVQGFVIHSALIIVMVTVQEDVKLVVKDNVKEGGGILVTV